MRRAQERTRFDSLAPLSIMDPTEVTDGRTEARELVR